ncbi:hypothetical protein F8M41_005708 [Gigaspora margarita]|uniref:Uncharacterized protein n=1 Tax=Gigaspora margarita TaxID=4874 RepID=A0A8H3X910_GIGMA|nr:hypothetical protein F8M41_005708 [Gigaspora margarita]
MKDWFNDEILDKWDLTNLKFICVANEVVESSEFDNFDDKLKEKYPEFIRINEGDDIGSNYFIGSSLKR